MDTVQTGTTTKYAYFICSGAVRYVRGRKQWSQMRTRKHTTDMGLLCRCLYPSNNTLKQVMDFHKTLYKFLATEGHSIFILVHFPRR